MASHIIATTVAPTVTLGSAAYAAQVTIARSGYVAPTAYGADGVFAAVTGARLANLGPAPAGNGQGKERTCDETRYF
jgi:hypothetical protein